MTGLPLSIAEAAAALRAGEVTSVELTTACIEAADRLDGELGTFLHRTNDSALAAAEQADTDLAAGVDRGPLQGIPFGIKDIFATSDAPTTAQSLVLDPAWGDQGDAPFVARVRQQGAVLMGKTSTMEFALGLPDPSKPFPVPRNPWDTSRWSGGSSSGNANGIAAGLFLGSIGSDTGGSIRLPSAFCGITGLKPTFGRVPKSGTVPLAWSLDHVGPMARTARDCAAILSVIAGHDPSDPLCSSEPVADYEAVLDGSLAGVRIGVARDAHTNGALALPNDDASQRFEDAVAALESAGAELVDVAIDHYAALVEATSVVLFSEAFAYHRENLKARWSDYGSFSRQMLSFGAFFSGTDYVQASRIRRAVRAKVDEMLGSLDAIVMLTAGAGAAPADGLDFMSALGLPVYTPVWNALGLPALSVPIGLGDDGLPIGMQIAGADFDEATVLRIGDGFQQITDFHRQVPSVTAAATP
jgi:aspartyl-tRNA(Asn)/glutamyl-tRNA(Gln) amidotransferase subunit A